MKRKKKKSLLDSRAFHLRFDFLFVCVWRVRPCCVLSGCQWESRAWSESEEGEEEVLVLLEGKVSKLSRVRGVGHSLGCSAQDAGGDRVPQGRQTVVSHHLSKVNDMLHSSSRPDFKGRRVNRLIFSLPLWNLLENSSLWCFHRLVPCFHYT